MRKPKGTIFNEKRPVSYRKNSRMHVIGLFFRRVARNLTVGCAAPMKERQDEWLFFSLQATLDKRMWL